jgi:hypothetical protein
MYFYSPTIYNVQTEWYVLLYFSQNHKTLDEALFVLLILFGAEQKTFTYQMCIDEI